MDRLRTLGLIYSLFLLALLPIHYVLWVLPGEELMERKHLALVAAALLVCLATIILAASLTPRTSDVLLHKLTLYLATRKYRIGLVLILVAVIWPCVTANVVLDRFMNSGDEFAYVFQARGLLEGRLWYEAPPLGYTFIALRTWIIGDKWVGQYPPGWPFLLAVGQRIGMPLWAVNAVFGCLLTSSFLVTVWRGISAEVALVMTAILISSPFYIFNAASYHSHITAAFSILSFTLVYTHSRDTHKPLSTVVAGALLGMLGTIRYFAVLLSGAALLIDMFQHRKFVLRSVIFLMLGGLPFVGVLLYYHFLVTGNPFKSTYAVIDWKEEAWLALNVHQLIAGMRLLTQGIGSLAAWTCPLLPLAYVICCISKMQARSYQWYDMVFPVFVMGHLLFPTLGGNRYGPRYYFDAYPLMLLTMATSSTAVIGWASRLNLRHVVIHGMGASLLYCLLSYPFVAWRYHAIIWERQDVFRLAEEAQLSNAVVLIKNGTGVLDRMNVWDLVRNEPGLKAKVLFALGIPALNRSTVDAGAIRQAFPHRSLWVYERQPGNPHGQLRPAE